MPGYLLQFGDYVFPGTSRPAKNGSSQHRAASQRPRASGSITQIARREESTVEIKGELTADTPADLLALLDALKSAIYGGKQKLFWGRDDMYFRDAQLQNYDEDWSAGEAYGIWAAVDMQFVAADYPERFATAATNATSAPSAILTPTGGTIAVVGESQALPLWTITIGATGTGPLTLVNTSTNEAAIINNGAGFTAGDIIALDRDGYIVSLNGTETFGVFDGQIPTLDPFPNPTAASDQYVPVSNVTTVPNVITLTPGGTATVAGLAVSYYARYK